ncbi:MAG: VPLPA-CTERM sorting domain-containing protein [Pseudomonadota bacterium]
MKVLLTAMALAGLAGVANAATVSFATSRGWNQGVNTYTGDGYTVNVNAARHNSSTGEIISYDAYTASWSGSYGGAGACSYPDPVDPYRLDDKTSVGSNSTAYCDESHQIDGYYYDEILELDWVDTTVSLKQLVFSYVNQHDYYDDFDLALYSGDGVEFYQQSIDIKSNGVEKYCNNSYDLCVYSVDVSSYNLIGSVIGVGASDKKAAFKLKKVKFHEVEVIPLPAAGFLLLGGLGGLLALRRRKPRA